MRLESGEWRLRGAEQSATECTEESEEKNT